MYGHGWAGVNISWWKNKISFHGWVVRLQVRFAAVDGGRVGGREGGREENNFPDGEQRALIFLQGGNWEIICIQLLFNLNSDGKDASIALILV